MSRTVVHGARAGAGLGFSLGAWIGVVDGWLALRAAGEVAGPFVGRLGTLLVAALIDASVGGVVAGVAGALLAAVLHVAQRAAPVLSYTQRVRSVRPVAIAILLATGAAVLVAVAGLVGPREGGTERPNFLLISVDTLRADHVGAYRYERATTPHLDQLAKGGALFESAYAQSSWTLPSHVSMLTGLDPDAHGVLTARDRIDPRLATLAEHLSQAGYWTGAWVGTPRWGYVGAQYGFDAGFDSYRHSPHPKRFRSSWLVRKLDSWLSRKFFRDVGNAREEVDSVLEWLHGARRTPFFLFVHFYDVHSKAASLPYEAPEPFFDRFCDSGIESFDGCEAGLCASNRLVAMARGEARRFDASELDQVRCLYDGGVAFVDDEIGRLFEALRGAELWKQTVVIVTSDHGEGFFEHGSSLHATLHDEITRVPLVVRLPGGGVGKRVRGVVSLTDLVPTVLELAGADVDPLRQGRSLVPVLQGGRDDVGNAAVAFDSGPKWAMIRRGDQKLIQFLSSGNARPRVDSELYNLALDPHERRNRARGKPRQVERLRAELRGRRQLGRSFHQTVLGGVPATSVDVGEEERKRLRALGYVE
ncbi:MAG: sulfatase [bacterium]|nr:sulfatase [bacterium]